MTTVYPKVLEFIDRLDGEKTAAEAWSGFLRFTHAYGFECGALSDVPAPGEPLDGKALCVTWPTGWRQRYTERGYVRRDPAVLHLARSFLPYAWSELLDSPDYGIAERRIVLEAGDFRLYEGFVVPLHGLRSGSAVLTIAGENSDMSRQDRAEVHLAAIYAHARIRGLAGARDDKRPNTLTRRECECLSWAAAGKSDWEISEILSISEKTANAHIESAKKKFEVTTRVQAVVHAIRLGIIRP